MSQSPERQQTEELVRIVIASVRECWQAYALQFPDGTPSPGAIAPILARSAYPILAKLAALPAELQPMLFASVVRTMLTAFLQITREEVARKHREMVDTLEREALKFADRAEQAIEEAKRQHGAEVARLAAEVKALRRKLHSAEPE